MNLQSIRLRLLITAAIVTTTGAARAQSNIDPAHKFAWGENIGWTNWRDADATAQGVRVTLDFLSGFIWGENAGWINVGNGPTNGVSYANADGTDFGVNLAANGDLSGFGWGENIGWVNFDTSSVAPDHARFDFAAARFRGYVWSENEGWINLDDGEHFVGVLGACCNFGHRAVYARTGRHR